MSAGRSQLLVPIVALSCAGCVGISLDMPRDARITAPIPKIASGPVPSLAPPRWACQRADDESSPYGPDDFLAAWGEPASRQGSPTGEIWTYSESWRWCGVWVLAIVPLPLLLPVCRTYDQVTFVDGRAISADSRRYSVAGLGIAMLPQAMFFPVPYRTRAGTITESNPTVLELPFDDRENTPCR